MRYRIDPRRVTLSEMRSEVSLPIAVLQWLITRLPLKLPCSSDIPAVNSLKPYLISKDDVPESIKGVIQELRGELESLGFRGVLYHCIQDPVQKTTIYYANFLHKSGAVIGRIRYRVFQATTPHKKFLTTELLTRFGDNQFVITSSGAGDLQVPAAINEEFLAKASPEQLWNRHRERLQDPKLRSNAVKVKGGQQLLDILEDHHEQVCNYFVERRLFVEIAKDVDHKLADPLLPVEEDSQPVEGSSPELPSEEASLVLTEVRNLESAPAASWNSLLLTLAVSVGLFVVAGGMAWDWKFTLLLVPILLFHELGHYLSMKIFDYSNVKMFFIPFFGAAVTGRHYNVPGWKRIFTSLMGPVPGILLGTGLGIVAMLYQYDSLMEAAILMLVLNGFNLLPTLPLDGGWVMHGLLFSRHAFLDFFFRLLAIGILLFLGAVGGGKLFLFLGIAMCIALPTSFHTARISDRLREAGGFAPQSTDNRIPTSAVHTISAELDRAYPKGMDVRAKAKLVLQIFEGVNSTPPGWIASLSLGTLYLASLAMVLVAGSIFFVAQHSDFEQLLDEMAWGPQNDLVVQDIVQVPQNSTPAELRAEEALIVSFPDQESAAEALEQLRAELPEESPLLLFGSTLCIPLSSPPAVEFKDKWFDQFEKDNNEVFLENAERPGTLNLQFLVPNVKLAEQIDFQLASYFGLPHCEKFVSPWQKKLALSEDELRARETVHKLLRQPWVEEVEFDEDAYAAISAAERRGQKEKVKKIQADIRAKYEKQLQGYVDELRALPEGQIDIHLLDKYELALENAADRENEEGSLFNIMPTLPAAEQWLDGESERLGLLPDADDGSVTARSGFSSRNGLFLNVNVTFNSFPVGALTFIRWLEQFGSTEYKYSVSGGVAF